MAIKDNMNILSVTFIVKFLILDTYFVILCSKCPRGNCVFLRTGLLLRNRSMEVLSSIHGLLRFHGLRKVYKVIGSRCVVRVISILIFLMEERTT